MKELLENQRENLFLWVPFIMAAGGALYFSCGTEPNIPFAPIVALALFITICIWRAPIIIRAILIFMFGFCYACAYTNIIDTPVMPRNMRNMEITGVVRNIDYTDDKARIYIRIPSRDININSARDATVRVSIAGTKLPNINDTIKTTATLFAPTPPDAPGGFDFARWAYFNGITATGYIDDFSIIDKNDHADTNNIRDFIHRNTNSMLVDGLVLGYKNTLPRDVRKIWTAAGVGHIWSISGFHMTLIMGWAFALFYFLFRAIPPIVRRVPAKQVAMICAWIILFLYVVISGMGVATLRAFLMATLVCVALVLGRGAFSLRNVCLAFCAIFLINPYYIMTAGFQLSFSAIFGLVWFWHIINPRMPESKIMRAIATAILTAVVASVFTAPFIALHFNSVPIYSIIGNLILLPIFSCLIMPLVIFGTPLALLGVHVPLDIANFIYDFSYRIANMIADLPASTINTNYIPNTAICFIILGMMCIVLIRPLRIKINYILGAVFISLGICVMCISPKPIFMATIDGELVGAISNDEIVFNKSRASNHYFTFDTWRRFARIAPSDKNTRAKHDHGLYIFKLKNHTIAYTQKFVPLQNNIVRLCHDDNIDYIVSYLNIHAPKCEHKILHGGIIIYESGKVIPSAHPRRWNNLH